LKIALLGPHPSRIWQLAAVLARRHHLVTVYGLDVGARLPDELASAANCRVVVVPAAGSEASDVTSPAMADLACYLDDDWTRERPDVVHAWGWTFGVAAQLAADRHHIPTVQTLSPRFTANADSGRVDGAEQADIAALLARKASGLAARCTEEIPKLVRLGASRHRISVIPRGVDVDQFSPMARVPRRDGLLRIVMAATDPSEPHGFATAITALRGIPHAMLDIAGGTDHDQLRQLADDLGLSERVRFVALPAYSDLPQLLHSADVALCIPPSEGSETIALEAMAAGVPIIASAVGELIDAVVHDITGLLIKPADPAGLARTVRSILADDFRREGMGFAGRTRARTRYTWDRIAVDALTAYTKAQDGHRATSSGLTASPARRLRAG
jgi:glycosyltransferase involved in cell wall biosynthesis